MSAPIATTDSISCEIDGTIYDGHVEIKGKRIRYQTIFYQGENESDSTQYRPDRQHLMKAKAQIIFRQLVRRVENL